MEDRLYKAKEEVRSLGNRVADLMLSDPEEGVKLLPSLLKASDKVDTIIRRVRVS